MPGELTVNLKPGRFNLDFACVQPAVSCGFLFLAPAPSNLGSRGPKWLLAWVRVEELGGPKPGVWCPPKTLGTYGQN